MEDIDCGGRCRGPLLLIRRKGQENREFIVIELSGPRPTLIAALTLHDADVLGNGRVDIVPETDELYSLYVTMNEVDGMCNGILE